MVRFFRVMVDQKFSYKSSRLLFTLVFVSNRIGTVSEPNERLDEIFQCKQCEKRFLFYSDVDSHSAQTGHADIAIVPLRDTLAE